MSQHNYDFKSEEIIVPKESLEIYDLDRHTLLEKLKSFIDDINTNIQADTMPTLEALIEF